MIKTQLSEEAFESLLRVAVIERCYGELDQYPSREELNLIDDSLVDPKIRKWIRTIERKSALKKIYRNVSKVAAVLLILCGLGFIGMLHVEEVRASCVNFFKTVYENFIRYDITHTLSDNDFVVEYIPTGYELVDNFQDEIRNFKIFENENEIRLTIDFIAMQKIATYIDSENCIINDFWIEGNKCQSFIYDNEKENKLIMITESGTFIIKGKLPKEELEKIAKNLK